MDKIETIFQGFWNLKNYDLQTSYIIHHVIPHAPHKCRVKKSHQGNELQDKSRNSVLTR